ncbi:enterochelin esterase domain-containing protein [Serratia ureilytica]
MPISTALPTITARPQQPEKAPGTDVWYGAAVVDRRWRGSYSLIPITARDLPPVFSDDETLRDRQQRAWWVSLFPLAIADPLNRTSLGPAYRPRAVSLAQGPTRTTKAPGRPPIGRWMKRGYSFFTGTAHGWAPAAACGCMPPARRRTTRTARWCCCSTARTGSKGTHCCR